MSEWFGQMLGFVASALGVVAMPDAAALGVAIALIALTTLTIVVALSVAPTSPSTAPHPLRAIDVSTLLAQSDPDAAGHPRPRAPGVAVPA
ncbi:hypothetical protein JOF42_003299 [Microbacterium phyllosphaerae]|uniref:Uncharacterized protein n=1 Tax=Microbacterium phyllosphaerae TaxID=124798 RepID=A0ABS4WUC5_9MICO|nr:DUF6412 domain-containing protein [Microbacterium phyllosphaerae]MBP2379804.1 hypothetical protein [Microbacterium phyllosphaerae]MCS3444042.1 hypothetical protein [Microbacterium phyllosphaerae]